MRVSDGGLPFALLLMRSDSNEKPPHGPDDGPTNPSERKQFSSFAAYRSAVKAAKRKADSITPVEELQL